MKQLSAKLCDVEHTKGSFKVQTVIKSEEMGEERVHPLTKGGRTLSQGVKRSGN